MPKASYALRLRNKDSKERLKLLEAGDTVETTETYTFKVKHNGINVKLVLTGNQDDIRKAFSTYGFDLHKKCYVQIDINSKPSQTLIDQFTKKKEEDEDEDEDEEEDEDEH